MLVGLTHIDNIWVMAAFFFLVGVFLFGPDSMISATAAMDFGTKRGAGTATGFVNGIGSIGGILGGYLPGVITTKTDWTRVLRSVPRRLAVFRAGPVPLVANEAADGVSLRTLPSAIRHESHFARTVGTASFTFDSLKALLAKASPLRSGDVLAGIAAENDEERVAAQMALADVPLARFLDEPIIPYEEDEVTRLIVDTHDANAFAPVADLTVGEFRDWLLGYETTGDDARATWRRG